MSAVDPMPIARARGRVVTPRLVAVDAARGIALIGMVIINVGPTRAEGMLERLYLLPYGRASVLFVVIAGLGMTLLLRSRDRRGTRSWPDVFWRSGLLLAAGLTLQLLTDHLSVILPTYALLFVTALLLHRMGDRALLACAAVLALIGPVLVIAAEVNVGRAKLPAPNLMVSPAEAIESMLVSGPYPIIIWAVPFMIGLWLGRRNLHDRSEQHRMISIGLTAGVVGAVVPLIAEAIKGSQHQNGYGLLLTGTGHGQMPLWLLSSCGGALLLLGLLLRFWDHLAQWCTPLVAAGQLALTLYVGHLLVLAVVGREAENAGQGALLSGTIILVAFPFAMFWSRRFGQGPMERLLRRPFGRAIVAGPDGVPADNCARRQ